MNSRPWVLQSISLLHATWSRQALAWTPESQKEQLSHTLGHYRYYAHYLFVFWSQNTPFCAFHGLYLILPCAFRHATQWESHIESFCEEDTSVKDRIYQCCRKDGSDRLDCFHNDAPNPSYDPTEELPVSPIAATTEFSFEPSTCQRYLWKTLTFKRLCTSKQHVWVVADLLNFSQVKAPFMVQ